MTIMSFLLTWLLTCSCFCESYMYQIIQWCLLLLAKVITCDSGVLEAMDRITKTWWWQRRCWVGQTCSRLLLSCQYCYGRMVIICRDICLCNVIILCMCWTGQYLNEDRRSGSQTQINWSGGTLWLACLKLHWIISCI